MGPRYTVGFRLFAVGIATTIGLTRPQAAADLGVGLSTLNKWVQKHQHDNLMSGPREVIEKENARLRKEVWLLREEREVLNLEGQEKAQLGRFPRTGRRSSLQAKVGEVPLYRGLKRRMSCRISLPRLKVTSRGFRAWRSHPLSQRQRDDMVILAYICEQYRLSLQNYGRPCMTEELQELGLQVGHRRVGRLMRQNGIKIIRTRKI